VVHSDLTADRKLVLNFLAGHTYNQGMRPLFRTSVWICLAIVALPLSPCAFFSSACCGSEHAADTQAISQMPVSAERPCCAKHSEPIDKPVQGEDSNSCQHECCKLSPFVPPAVPVMHDAPLMLAMVALPPEVSSAVSSPREFERDLPAVAIPLNLLHCQWRN
jgi:hypothetical protein